MKPFLERRPIPNLEKILLSQDDLELGSALAATRAINNVRPQRKLIHENEWFTRRCSIRVVRRLDQVALADASVAKGAIVVKGHPTVTANISLGGALRVESAAGAGTLIELTVKL